MKIPPISIHLVLNTKADLTHSDNPVVCLRESRDIKRLRNILNTRPREEAIRFALTKGEIRSTRETKVPVRLILCKDGAFWDQIK